MVLLNAQLRDFRSYRAADAALGPALTVVHGPNGAGKSNLLEAICFGCTARSPRTRNDRELVAFGAQAARVNLTVADRRGEPHEISVAFGASGPDGRLERRIRFDGGPLARIDDVPDRPLVAVFIPDRLTLITGPPAVRRAHTDHLVAALWPSRASHRSEYAQALAQRNALLMRIRAGAPSSSLASWDMELARRAIALSADRTAAVREIAEPFRERCARLGLEGEIAIEHRPAVRTDSVDALAAELASRLAADVQRGFTGHGPHRDEIAIIRERRHLRTYGSQGERRLALLALLLAERSALAAARGTAPLMLLDDALSELDRDHRRLLLDDLAATGGQSVIATADVSELRGMEHGETSFLEVGGDGTITAEHEGPNG